MMPVDNAVLLVEGPDDFHVLCALFIQYKLPDAFEIIPKKGIEHLIKSLDVEVDTPDRKILGIIVDADTNINKRWNEIRNKLIERGYGSSNIPETPRIDGIIIDKSRKPIVGIWLMPNNALPGMLENFIEFLVPVNDSLWPYAENCLQAIPYEDRPFKDKFQKARVHTWLAWQEEPGTPMGLAITKKYLKNIHSEQCLRFIAWIRRLYGLEEPTGEL